MLSLIFLLSFASIFVFLILLIINAIRGKEKRIHVIGAIMCFAIFIASYGALKDSKELPSEEVQGTKEGEWVDLANFNGNSIKNTESFKVSSKEWRILWVTKPGNMGSMNFQIMIHKTDGEFVDLAANIIGEGKDVSYMYGKGDYYLTINTAQPYSIIVQEKK